MTENPVMLARDANVLDVTRTLRENAVRRLPIVTDEGKLVGIGTLDDVMHLLGRDLNDLAGVIEAESPPY